MKKNSAKDNEVNKERAEIEKHKRDLQRQLQDLHFDLESQRTALKNDFDEVMRKREHEWRLESDEFNSAILAKELEVSYYFIFYFKTITRLKLHLIISPTFVNSFIWTPNG